MEETKAAILQLNDNSKFSTYLVYMQRCFLLKLFNSGLKLLKDSHKEIYIIDLWSFIYADQRLSNPVQKHRYLIKSHKTTTALKRENLTQ